MIDLKHAVQQKGYTVAHIKTDSIKIPDADQEIIDFVINFGDKYGYQFEHEATYDRFCLVNDAVYVAHKDHCNTDCWVAVGAQFQHAYVFKTLFGTGEVTFDDLCETKQVTQGNMYLGDTFIGRTGRFVPVLEGGAPLMRVKDDKSYAVTGTKDHLWVEAEMAQTMGDKLQIDMSYFEKLADQAWQAIDYFGSVHDFVGSK